MQTPTIQLPNNLAWQLSSFEGDSEADFLNWSPRDDGVWKSAPVPGCVQTAPGFGLPYPDVLERGKWEALKEMERMIWVYRTVIPAQAAPVGRNLLIRFNGLDYRARIFLNGELHVDHEGMFSPVEIELDAERLRHRNHSLHVAFLPSGSLYPTAAEILSNVNAASNAPQHLKARYMSGWDFCPELKCTGIWDAVDLEWRSPCRIQYLGVEARIANAARAEVFVDVHLKRPEMADRIRLSLAGATAEVPVHGRAHLRVGMVVENPSLWFPHTHGKPVLHELTANLYASAGEIIDITTIRTGIRSISRRAAEGQRPTDTPSQYLINDIPVFLCGANLTPFSSIPSEVHEEDYLKVLAPLQNAGVNFLRVWGGGLREKKAFYDLCDEMGFLVMQEFPLACQKISREPAFLALLEREGRAILQQLKHHPCVAIWSGGNEHYHFWEAVDSGSQQMLSARTAVQGMFGIEASNRPWRAGEPPDHPALQILQSLVAEEAPIAHYNITSGLEEQGETHGPWTFRLEIGDHRFRDLDFYECWREGKSNLYSEASVSGPAHPETIARILGVDRLEDVPVPADRSAPLWVAHKAFKAAWDGFDDNWLDITGAEQLFGPMANMAELVQSLSYIQCEAARYMIESVRRRQGRTTGIVWWGINEPFPGIAGNALVDFFGRPKPALRILQAAFRPHLLSLDYHRLLAPKLRGQICFTNSTNREFNGSFRALTRLQDGEPIDRRTGSIQMNSYSAGPLVELTPLPLGNAEWGTVDLDLYGPEDELLTSNRYRIFPASKKHPLRPLFKILSGDIAALFTEAT